MEKYYNDNKGQLLSCLSDKIFDAFYLKSLLASHKKLFLVIEVYKIYLEIKIISRISTTRIND